MPHRANACLAVLATLSSGSLARADGFDDAYRALTLGQRTRIAQHVRAEGRSESVTTEGFVAAIGALVPDGIPLHWMHAEAGLSRFRYIVVGGQGFIVEPNRRRILGRIE
jgi:hypothetical protein